MKKPMISFSVLVMSVIGIGGCAGRVPAPASELDMAATAILQAESSGAYEIAPFEFQTASDKLSQARRAAQREDNENAQLLAAQAVVDANLAEAKAKNAKAKKAEIELREGLRVLREEINRKGRE